MYALRFYRAEDYLFTPQSMETSNKKLIAYLILLSSSILMNLCDGYILLLKFSNIFNCLWKKVNTIKHRKIFLVMLSKQTCSLSGTMEV